ncbi:PREDICTED: uncharacterized protein LOC109484188 [Branchiostoma belcheri]|uniref:Uncharacterized protein LOC109484188 n=1 Tax=Branchiostoma belcheri TaxID=7741 RepID=A0A6P5A140_BRABE|nr:PREDICTED: uncharacterized protein LOC109484188 [Branchiostoma belcheri]
MAGPVRERVTAADRRHFDFVQTLLRISDNLTKEETANIKLFCMHLIPKGLAAQLRRAVDVFHKLIELDKIDQENLDFLEELLERMGRRDLIQDVLRPFQPPDREIPESAEIQPENPELQPGTSAEGACAEVSTTSGTFLVFRGQSHMTQETIDHQRRCLASLLRTRRSQVKFRRYKKHKSILVHYTVPRENTAVLRLMADHSDPRLVFMGMESLQIDAGVPIKLQQEGLLYDVKRQLPVDDIEVGCSTYMKQQRAPRSWTRLSALNLFSDALPLYLQVAASLEYQGFSYCLVQALAERDRLREHQMRQAIHNLRKAEVESNKLQQKVELDSNTLMTLRSKLVIADNRLKEALEMNAVLKVKLLQAQEYAEKAASREEATHITEYRGEKPPVGWQVQFEKADAATRICLADTDGTTGRPEDIGDKVGKESLVPEEHKKTVMQDSSIGIEKVLREKTRPKAGLEGAAPRTTGDMEQVVSSTQKKHMKPRDVCMDSNGTKWVLGSGGAAHHVVQYSTDGTAMARFDLQENSHSRGIAVNMRTNHILVTDAVRGEVEVFHPDGSLVRTVRHPRGEMRNPQYITVDGEGNIFVSDWGNHSVYVYDELGKFKFQFGGPGGDEGQLKYPLGICTDSSGHIILADAGNERVQIFSHHGEYLRSIRTGTGADGLAVGPEGQLVVTSSGNHTVTVFPSY